MAEDYYGDEDAAAPAAAPAAKPKTAETKTALIDSAICPGMKPGDEMVVKIEKVMDKEYLVSYAPEPEDKGEESTESEAAPSGPPSAATAPSMAGMME